MRVLTWAAILATLGGITAYVVLVPLGYSARFGEQKTVEQRVAQYGEAARQRLAPDLDAQGVTYPPKRVVLLALKSERQMELWAANGDDKLQLIRTYRIHGLSGVAGPKLREGDRQVPEGVYAIESLNPNSRYHLSLRVGYPNEFDRRQAGEDGRTNLGGDIMIHGGSSSIGCLAMGDEAAEELFVLAAQVGIGNVRVIICPHDLRMRPATEDPQTVDWAGSLYGEIRQALTELE